MNQSYLCAWTLGDSSVMTPLSSQRVIPLRAGFKLLAEVTLNFLVLSPPPVKC